ncbi:MAG: DUF2723 domain-containing protein [Anaerolineae bacterium]|nr:DUF2723 domain-containing protein [Anaerolineae bacterium]
MASLPNSPNHRPGRLAWIAAAVGGGVWGLGLARVLAHDLRVAFTHQWAGVAVVVLLGALAAVIVHRQLIESTPGAGSRAGWYLPLFLPTADLLASDPQPWRGPALLVGAIGFAVALVTRPSKARWFLLSVLIPLLVYLPDISPYVGRADTFEFQVIGPQLGIAHPSGYPLYTLLCKLFSLLPGGTPAWRVNLTSAVFASLAAGFLFLALAVWAEGETSQWGYGLAFCAALILAFSPTLWARAIEAEVYALNALLVTLALWLTVRWQGERLPPDRAWPVLGLILGVSLASHVTLGALGLVAVTGLLTAGRRPGARAWGAAVVLGLLGLALYAYIPLRWPAVTGGERMSLTTFLRFVSNADSGGALRPLAFYRDLSRWSLVGQRLLAQVGWAGLALAAIGLASLAFKMPALALGTSLAFAAWIWFNLGFYVADPDYSAFLIPAHVLLVFWLGRGAQTVLGHLGWGRRQAGGAREDADARVVVPRKTTGDLYRPMAVTAMALFALGQLWETGPALDTVSQGRADELWARHVLQLPLANGAAILADSEKFPPLYYLQQVEGIRPDLEMVTLFSEAQYRADLETRLAAGQPVYLARYLPGMDAFGVSAMGPLVAVAPSALAGTQGPSGVAFGEDLVLHAYGLEADSASRPLHHLTLTWQVVAQPRDDLEVRLRLVDRETGHTVWQADAIRPVAGYTTTTAWQAGWQVDDYHALAWPAWLPPRDYDLEVALFPRFDDQGLSVDGTRRVWHPLDHVTVPAQPGPALSQSLDIRYGSDAWLVGIGAPAEVTVGRAFWLDLTWWCGPQALSLPDPQAHLLPVEGGAPTATEAALQGDGAAFGFCAEDLPLPVLRRYALTAPSQPGRYRLEFGVGTGNARCGWLHGETSACALAELTVVSPAGAGLASFNGGIVLVDAHVDASEVLAGGPLLVDLTWRAQESLAQNYTVFVQVVGPDGQLYGQVDSWPVQGARPTTSWQAGDTIEDRYRFFVDGEAPPGDYRVIVGWYLLADMTRLAVVDSSGREIADYWQIGAFALP